MEEKRHIVIAEDHTILREGLRSLLSASQDLEVVAEAEDGLEAVRCAEEYNPDLILLDLSMPRMSGADAVKEISKRSPETKILVLTVHKSEEYVLSVFQSGADNRIRTSRRKIGLCQLSPLERCGRCGEDNSPVR